MRPQQMTDEERKKLIDEIDEIVRVLNADDELKAQVGMDPQVREFLRMQIDHIECLLEPIDPDHDDDECWFCGKR